MSRRLLNRLPTCWWIASLLAPLLLLGVGCPKDPVPLECGDVRQDLGSQQSPIVNGDASFDPTVVSLTPGQKLAIGALMRPDGNGGWTPFCTGTVVTPTVVLSAAHCARDFRGRIQRGENVRFGIGEDVANPRALAQPLRLAPDPLYDQQNGGAAHDISLLLFDKPLTELVPELTPIRINPDALPASLVGERLQNVGFGCLETDCTSTNSRRFWAVEQVVEVTTIDIVMDGGLVSGVCFGDSGGPVLRSYPDGELRVIATVSWGGAECAGVDHFARVDDEAHLLDLYAPDCGDLGAQGRCDGAVASYCEQNVPKTIDCASLGEACGDDGSGRGAMRCVDPCAGETLAGRCDGDDLIWCEAGGVKLRRCADCAMSCGVPAGGTRHDCR